jgi:hypothetical protein
LNSAKIQVGDIVTFKDGDGKILTARVNSKGQKFQMRMIPTNGEVLYVNVFEHPEWKDVTILAKQVIDILVLPEKVQFS